jgi:hypothetical protein
MPFEGAVPGQAKRFGSVLGDRHLEAQEAQGGGHGAAEEELVVHHEQVPVISRHHDIAACHGERRVREACEFRVNTARGGPEATRSRLT